jgi:uncharacterized protein (UPF0276 family)
MQPVGIGWRHPHYAGLLEDRPAVDFLEVHSENFFGDGGAALAVLAQARRDYPISLHGVGLGLGSAAGQDGRHLGQLAALVERIEPASVSDHACFARAPLDAREVHAADLLPLPWREDALDVLCRNVQQVQERLRRPLLVENLSAYFAFGGATMHEADFFAQLVRRTGCRVLLDVNNLYVNALNAGAADPLRDCAEWLDRLPPGTVGEIHLAGHRELAGIVIDDHGSRVCEPVWRLYEHATARFGPVPALVEWDTELPPLATLLAEAALARDRAARQVEAPA